MKKNTTQKRFQFALRILAVLVLGGCASRAPLTETEKADENLRQWTSKVEVFDRKQDRKHSIEMDFLARGEDRLRIDVSANFAVPLAAAVMKDGEMTCLLPREKRFYQGASNRAALTRALKVPLDPMWISAVLRDRELKGWTCVRDAQGLPQSCENLAESRKVTWSERKGDYKKVLITDPRFEFDFKLKEVPTKVQDMNKAFTLKVPDGYESVKP
jgi:outer membrane biogenesis lipoprotein LolB